MRIGLAVCVFLSLLLVVFCTWEKISLNDANFDHSLEKLSPTDDLLIVFSADWCGACSHFKGELRQFLQDYNLGKAGHSNLKVAEIDMAKEPGLSCKFMICRLPSIFHYRDHQFRALDDHFTANNLTAYFSEAQWDKIQPRSEYIDPLSTVARFLGYMGIIGEQVMSKLQYLRDNYPPYVYYAILVAAALIPLIIAFLLNRGDSKPKKGGASRKPKRE